MNTHSFITRICDNSADWQRPSNAPKLEGQKSYSVKSGFGHEEWIFRSEWLIDGWRYAFLQGVNRSYKRMSKADRPFDVTLYTILGDKRRQYVATIRDVECLSPDQADDAVAAFKQFGWYDQMIKEIRAVGGDEEALGAAKYTRQILNIRFRLENVTRFSKASYAVQLDPVNTLKSYQLVNAEHLKWSESLIRGNNRKGTGTLPNVQPYSRNASGLITCTPEHARMQKKLMEELRAEYLKGEITRESNYIDVRVQTETELLLFEIKSDLDPRTVIRQALGQIIEYAYHPRNKHALSPQLVIVGRKPLSTQDANYIEILRKDYNLPLTYRVVEL